MSQLESMIDAVRTSQMLRLCLIVDSHSCF